MFKRKFKLVEEYIGHLKSQFVLFVVLEGPHFVDHILQIRFDKIDCRLKSLSNIFFCPLRPFVVVIATMILNIIETLFSKGGFLTFKHDQLKMID